MADLFESSKFNIAWAKDHIAALGHELNVFLNDEDACVFITEPDTGGNYNLVKFKLSKPMPRAVRGHVGDSAVNLRSALDQAICAVGGGYFPIRNTKTDFESAMKDVRKRVPNEIADIVLRSKPYKGGNDLLWALNKLSGTNKHGIIRPAIPAHSLVQASGYGPRIQIPHAPEWNSDKDEMILARIPVNTEFEMNYQFALFVAYNEIEFIDGKEIVPVLVKFVDIVEGIVMAIEAESRSIGLC